MIKHIPAEQLQQLCAHRCMRAWPFAYSADFALRDYHLFQHLERFLIGKQFPSDDDVQTFITCWFRTQARISSTPVYRNWAHGMTHASISVIILLKGC
ncbi:hypothetical protein AVEN_275559-1 [Araneus ventricosus]|uniref:Uncharacterized protein n=1 Tax=Araneus ventricosus TaxID=182803 RepID=A0A4Y2THI2_ARAVE|nr:hypothetical protein AVEN_275559-1 [Araneus ventricosus]